MIPKCTLVFHSSVNFICRSLAISIFIVNVFIPAYYITLLDWHKLWIVVAKEVMTSSQLDVDVQISWSWNLTYIRTPSIYYWSSEISYDMYHCYPSTVSRVVNFPQSIHWGTLKGLEKKIRNWLVRLILIMDCTDIHNSNNAAYNCLSLVCI